MKTWKSSGKGHISTPDPRPVEERPTEPKFDITKYGYEDLVNVYTDQGKVITVHQDVLHWMTHSLERAKLGKALGYKEGQSYSLVNIDEMDMAVLEGNTLAVSMGRLNEICHSLGLSPASIRFLAMQYNSQLTYFAYTLSAETDPSGTTHYGAHPIGYYRNLDRALDEAKEYIKQYNTMSFDKIYKLRIGMTPRAQFFKQLANTPDKWTTSIWFKYLADLCDSAMDYSVTKEAGTWKLQKDVDSGWAGKEDSDED